MDERDLSLKGNVAETFIAIEDMLTEEDIIDPAKEFYYLNQVSTETGLKELLHLAATRDDLLRIIAALKEFIEPFKEAFLAQIEDNKIKIQLF